MSAILYVDLTRELACKILVIVDVKQKKIKKQRKMTAVRELSHSKIRYRFNRVFEYWNEVLVFILWSMKVSLGNSKRT